MVFGHHIQVVLEHEAQLQQLRVLLLGVLQDGIVGVCAAACEVGLLFEVERLDSINDFSLK